MEVLNPICMVPNMTTLCMEPNMTTFTKMTKRQKKLIFIFRCLMKRGGVDRMFPFPKRDISESCSKYEQKHN